ncbi:hypothetical protein HHI36_010198 [Cryptolaemus montrouzieri]|uniref:Uncharacterized protein n=1 Tax=Cryptolaemus montrouzieri TaxID=559131 RepID=A0ABD2MHZ6_9CUCU
MVAGGPDVKPNSATKSCRKCGIIPKSCVKCILCGSLNHPGCIEKIKHIKLVDDEVICCKITEKKIDLDDLDNVEPTPKTEMDPATTSSQKHYKMQKRHNCNKEDRWSNVAKKSATQRHVDNNDIDQLVHDRESNGEVNDLGSGSQQENKTTTKESEKWSTVVRRKSGRKKKTNK